MLSVQDIQYLDGDKNIISSDYFYCSDHLRVFAQIIYCRFWYIRYRISWFSQFVIHFIHTTATWFNVCKHTVCEPFDIFSLLWYNRRSIVWRMNHYTKINSHSSSLHLPLMYGVTLISNQINSSLLSKIFLFFPTRICGYFVRSN